MGLAFLIAAHLTWLLYEPAVSDGMSDQNSRSILLGVSFLVFGGASSCSGYEFLCPFIFILAFPYSFLTAFRLDVFSVILLDRQLPFRGRPLSPNTLFARLVESVRVCLTFSKSLHRKHFVAAKSACFHPGWRWIRSQSFRVFSVRRSPCFYFRTGCASLTAGLAVYRKSGRVGLANTKLGRWFRFFASWASLFNEHVIITSKSNPALQGGR